MQHGGAVRNCCGRIKPLMQTAVTVYWACLRSLVDRRSAPLGRSKIDVVAGVNEHAIRSSGLLEPVACNGKQ